MKCTLKDIAQALGCTVNTVSRALRGGDDISKATILAVREKAEELGYIPNIAASSLRSGRSQTVAVVYDNLLNPYYYVMTKIIEESLNKRGYGVMIFTDMNYEAVLTKRTAERILSYNIDGIISFLQVQEETKALIERSGKALIVLGRDSSDSGIDSIFSDDYTGGYLATRAILETGRRKILYFSLNEYISCSNLRREGYRKALAEYGVPEDDSRILVLGTDGWTGDEMVRTALSRKLDFDAIFCVNDLVAYETISELGEHGFSVPDDFAVVGYDYLESHLKFPGKLTTVDADKSQMAEVACEVILHKIENETQKSRLFTKVNPVSLVYGKTI